MAKSLIVEVVSGEATEFKGTSAKTGREYHMHFQDAYAHIGGTYPVPVRLNLDTNAKQEPYAAGKYEVAADSFELADGGNLRFKRFLRLVPVSNSTSSVAPKL